MQAQTTVRLLQTQTRKQRNCLQCGDDESPETFQHNGRHTSNFYDFASNVLYVIIQDALFQSSLAV